MIDISGVEKILQSMGLIMRGGFHPHTQDQVPAMTDSSSAATVILAGNAGPQMWTAFQHARSSSPIPPDLDTWTEQGLTAAAHALGAEVLFPFGGPPFWPFQRWAQRAEAVFPSPIGPLIHGQYGLWHAYRGAFLFSRKLSLPSKPPATSPCDSCQDRPCLGRCPVNALSSEGYKVSVCRTHLLEQIGNACISGGCLARHACPVGHEFKYGAEQASFHMRAFSGGG